MWINAQGGLYDGDCVAGDRAATDAEVSAWQAARAAIVPQRVTAAQIIRGLDHMGLLAGVKAAVVQAGGLTQDLWNHAPFLERDDPMIAAVAQAMGKTDDDLDNLFRLSATF